MADSAVRINDLTEPTTDVETAGALLGISRSTSYGLAQRGQFPCKVIRVGRQYRVVVSSLREVLGVSA